MGKRAYYKNYGLSVLGASRMVNRNAVNHNLSDYSGWIAKSDLLGIVNQSDCGVSETQLKRLHPLFKTPTKQKRLGRKGTVTLYPPGSTELVLAICRINSARKKTQPLRYIGWQLWWQGLPVSMKLIRQVLSETEHEWLDTLVKLRDKKSNGLSKYALEMVRKSQSAPLRNKFLTSISRRVLRSKLPLIVKTAFEVMIGSFESFQLISGLKTNDDVEQLFERGLNLEEARTPRILGLKTWLESDLNEELRSLTRLMSGDELSNRYALKSSDATLNRARGELVELLTGMKALSTAIKSMFGKGALGLTHYSTVIEGMGVREQSLALRLWLFLRKTKLSEGMDTWLSSLRKDLPEVLKLEVFFRLIRAELPWLAKEFTPSRFLAALANPNRAKRFHESLARLRSEHEQEMDEFWRRHTELVII